MRVLLVDDHPLFRQGLRALLEANDSIKVVGEASDGSEAVDLTKKLTPDVVIMDISMPGYCGLDATRQIKEDIPGTKILILSRQSDNIFVDQALKAGASGYVHKDAAFDELQIALDALKKDRPYLSPAVLQTVFDSYLQSTPAASAIVIYNKLTYREKEVFNLLLKSYSRSVIAETLNISPKTVDRHRTNLLDKLKLRKETEILQFAKLIGLNEP
jgi:DNA-binding NarL/FixJ family response regulator